MVDVEPITRIALRSGEMIRQRYAAQNARVARKPDGSPVTDVDCLAERWIRDDLKVLDPSIPILSEESDIPDYTVRKGWRCFWMVDPLDGTKEFLNRTDEFTINIALIQDEEPILGVIYAPALRVLYFAQHGKGAWKQPDGDLAERLCSRFPDPTQALTVVESRSHPSPALERFLRAYRIKDRVRTGSSLKFCLVAEGKADIYPRFGPTMEWDVAAGDCIYRNSAAEGQHPVTLRYNKPSLRNDHFVIGLRPGTFVMPE